LPRPRQLVPYLGITLGYWLLNAASAWLLAWGCGLLPISFPQAMVIVGVIALGILSPSAPGFFGAFQMACYAALALYFPASAITQSGAAFVGFAYTVQVGITLSFAMVSAWLGHTSLTEGLSPEPAAPAASEAPGNLSDPATAR
jgi:hypothetical protein